MKIQLLTAALLLSLVSCNEPKKEDNVATSKVELLTSLEETEDTTKHETKDSAGNIQQPIHESSGARVARQPLLIARGSEPGWYAEFYTDHVSMLLDYGKDTIKVEHDFSSINKDKSYKATMVNVTNNNGKKSSLSLQINIEDKSCTEMSGEKRDKAITLKYNNKEYKGCAETK
ncbi:MAG: hypothetical protein ACXVNM_12785 [Bacteroidia bacterium]